MTGKTIMRVKLLDLDVLKLEPKPEYCSRSGKDSMYTARRKAELFRQVGMSKMAEIQDRRAADMQESLSYNLPWSAIQRGPVR